MRSVPKVFLAAMLLAAVATASLGCGSGSRAVRGPGGAPLVLDVVLDRSVGQLPNAEQVDQVAGWMEPDLHQVLTNFGYQVVPQGNPQAYQPAPGRFLLIVKITRYNAGSKAARMFVGLGAGAASLAAHYTLFGPRGPVNEGDISVASGRDWQFCARKVNTQTADRITALLNALPPG
jgi:hypothetical protein